MLIIVVIVLVTKDTNFQHLVNISLMTSAFWCKSSRTIFFFLTPILLTVNVLTVVFGIVNSNSSIKTVIFSVQNVYSCKSNK
jgi:hypothetical protein